MCSIRGFTSRQGNITVIYPTEQRVALGRATGKEGGMMHYRCLLFRSTPDLTDPPPAMLLLKAATFYSYLPGKQPGNVQTDGLKSSNLFSVAFDS